MATDRLREAKPRRLHRDQGVWVLDVERFVSLGQGVLRPKVERLQGEIVIQQYLAQHPGAHALSRTVSQLMRDTGGDGKTAPPVFEVVGEGWVPVFAAETDVMADAPTRPSPRPAPPTTAASEPTRPAESPDTEALVRALGAMRLAHNKLQARVEELERQLALVTGRPTGVGATAPMMPAIPMPPPPVPAAARPAAPPLPPPSATAPTQLTAQARVTVPRR